MTIEYSGTPGVDYPFDGLDIFDRLYNAGAKSTMLDVLAYLFRHADPEDGFIVATYERISKKTGRSMSAVSKAMKKLQDNGIVKKVHNGIWQVDLCIPPADYDGPISFIRREA